MDSVGYLRVLRRRWVTVVITAVLVAVLAGAYTFRLTPQYRATASLFYSVTASDSASELVQGTSYTQQVVKSYTDVASSPLVLEPVIESLGLDETAASLGSRVTATVALDTVIIDVSVTGTSPAETTRIANAVADQLRETSEELSPRAAENRATIDVTVIRPATVPGAPFAPNRRLYLAAGLLAGVLLGLALALARDRLSSRVRTDDDVEVYTDVPVLAHIPTDRSRRIEPALTGRTAHGPRSEAVRRLRINLESLGVLEQTPALLVTSALPGEGKSTTAVDLALAFVETRRRVLLIDADLRRPRLARYLGLEQSVGLSGVLLDEVDLETAVQPWRHESLHILTSGDLHANPSRLLGASHVRSLLKRCRAAYDVVIIDGAPLLPVADSTELSKVVDGTLLVVSSPKLRVTEFERALGTLNNAGANLLGVLLNMAPRSRHSQYHYGYASPTSPGRLLRWLDGRSRRRDRAYAEARRRAIEESDGVTDRETIDARDG